MQHPTILCNLKPTTETNRRRAILVVALVIAGAVSDAAPQDVVTDFWTAKHIAVLHDFGYSWSNNTIFKPYRWERVRPGMSRGIAPNLSLNWIVQDLSREADLSEFSGQAVQDTLNFRWWNGLFMQNPAGKGSRISGFTVSPYSRLTVWFRTRLHAQLFFRATDDPSSLAHFTGRPREVRRFGLNSAEFDFATVGYHSSWLTAQFGRGRQIWGPMETSNLVLSDNSPAYDHFLLEGRYKRFKLRFFYAFLESLTNEVNINRYMVGHGLEYSNGRNLVLALSEIVIFSGADRPLDISFLNPFAFALEVEFNDRTNKDVGTSSSNAVWSANFDWMPLPGLRLSGNFTFDEFQFDSQDREQGRPDATAYQFRAAYSSAIGRVGATLFGDYTRVGTFTFSHDSGVNNFVSRDLPLGSAIGSDSDRLRLGVRFVLPFRTIFSCEIGRSRHGERNILSNPYQFYTEEEFRQAPFPSGVVQEVNFLDWRIGYSPWRNFDFSTSGRFSNSKGRVTDSQSYLILSANAYLPSWFGF